jgi:hypothetical protein
MQRVEVTWIDSARTEGWVDSDGLAKEFAANADGGCAECVTVGMLWQVGPTDIVVARDQQPSKVKAGPFRVCDVIAIPRVAIRNFVLLSHGEQN